MITDGESGEFGKNITDGESGEFGKKQLCVNCWEYLCVQGGGGVMVKALCYRPAGRGFDSRWCHWNFSVT